MPRRLSDEAAEAAPARMPVDSAARRETRNVPRYLLRCVVISGGIRRAQGGEQAMAIVTVGDVLDKVEGYEKRLECYYAAVRDKSTDNGVRLLTYCLSRRRRRLRSALDELAARDVRRMRHVKLKTVDLSVVDRQPHHARLPPAKTAGPDLIRAAVEHGATLTGLYKHVLADVSNPAAKTFFETLVRIEERDGAMLKRMVAIHYF
jgi:hypothetical protein